MRAPYDNTATIKNGHNTATPGAIRAVVDARLVLEGVTPVLGGPVLSRMGYVTLDGPVPNLPVQTVVAGLVETWDYGMADVIEFPGDTNKYLVMFCERMDPPDGSPSYYRAHVSSTFGWTGPP